MSYPSTSASYFPDFTFPFALFSISFKMSDTSYDFTERLVQVYLDSVTLTRTDSTSSGESDILSYYLQSVLDELHLPPIRHQLPLLRRFDIRRNVKIIRRSFAGKTTLG